MRFVWLELPFHDDTLLKKVCQPRHDDGVKQVDFEEEPVPDMEAKERDPLDQGDPGNEAWILSILVTPIAHSQSVIYG
jgi:hypothetical protein